jgi:hypothetical protein
MTAVQLSSSARIVFVCRKFDAEQITTAVIQKNAEKMLWVRLNV